MKDCWPKGKFEKVTKLLRSFVCLKATQFSDCEHKGMLRDRNILRGARTGVAGTRAGFHKLTQNPNDEIKKVEKSKAQVLRRTTTALTGVDLAVARYRKRARQVLNFRS